MTANPTECFFHGRDAVNKLMAKLVECTQIPDSQFGKTGHGNKKY